MPRKPVQRSNEHFYHISGRSNNREFFFLSKNEVWEIMSLKLAKLQIEFQIIIAAFVFMDNHFHLLVLTPLIDIDRIMYFFMKDVTIEIQKKTGRINKIFGGRYKGSLINSANYLINVYKYIYRNPVEAGLVEFAELYQFSSLYYRFKNSRHLAFKVDSVDTLAGLFVDDRLDELKWINIKYDEGEAASIKSGLRKTVFSYAKDRKSNRGVVPVFRC